MASILDLSTPFEGMSYIYNVDARVGWIPGSCPNQPDDVQLVQFLLFQLCMRSGDMARGEWDFPAPTGKMDALTNFWIFVQQRSHQKTQHQTIDGVISPAHGAHYGSQEWTIVSLNSEYRLLYGNEAFENLPNNPALSPTLRKALQDE